MTICCWNNLRSYQIPQSKILVTGCNSSIGSKLVIDLLKKGCTVVGVDRQNSRETDMHRLYKSIKKSVPCKFTFSKTCLADRHKLSLIFQRHGNIKTLVHFAMASEKNSTLDNVQAMLNLLEQARRHGIDNIVLSSRLSWKSEPSPTLTIIEELLSEYRGRVFIIRHARHDLLKLMADHAVSETALTVTFSDLIREYFYLHVNDIVSAFSLTLTYLLSQVSHTPFHKLVNLVSPTGISLDDLSCLFQKTNNVHLPIIICSEPEAGTEELRPQNTSLTEMLGYRPCYSWTDICQYSFDVSLKTR